MAAMMWLTIRGCTHEVISGLRGCVCLVDAVVGGGWWRSTRMTYELHNFCVGHATGFSRVGWGGQVWRCRQIKCQMGITQMTNEFLIE